MRFLLLSIGIFYLLTSCKSDDNVLQDDNNFLPNVPVNIQLNLDLPQYTNLKFPGGTFILDDFGINGIYVSNLNNSIFNAFELTDPNRPVQSCSKLTVEGINATSSCEGALMYNLLDGQRSDKKGFTLRRYSISKNGNTLLITN